MRILAQGRARFSRLAVVVGAVALAGTGACAAKVEREAPDEAAASQELAHQGHHHFRGPVKVVIEAARQHGELNADQQQALDAIAADLEDQHESHRELHERLRMSAVAVVRAGSADSEEFEAGVAEAVAAVEQRVQQGADALEEIHTMLDDDQRAAVAAALRAHIDERFGPKPDRRDRGRDGFKRFASHLVLTGLQIDQLRTIRTELIGETRELRPSRDELHALVDAFEGDDFGTKLDEFHAKKSRILRARVARAGERTDTVLSIFTPEQRELIADLILEGPRKVLLGEDAPSE